jgi:hypothetical protein
MRHVGLLTPRKVTDRLRWLSKSIEPIRKVLELIGKVLEAIEKVLRAGELNICFGVGPTAFRNSFSPA